MNRWFPAALLFSAVFLSNTSFTAAFADDKGPPGHTHADAKPDESKIKAAIAKLPEGDRAAALAQRYCPLMPTARLGAMGVPTKVTIDGQPVFVCCGGCEEEAVKQGKAVVGKVAKLKKSVAAIAKLPAADQPIAEAQLFCAVSKGSRLGSMGTPVKLTLEGKPVFLCCKGCEQSARANPDATLTRVEEIKKQNAKAAHHDGDGHDHH